MLLVQAIIRSGFGQANTGSTTVRFITVGSYRLWVTLTVIMLTSARPMSLSMD